MKASVLVRPAQSVGLRLGAAMGEVCVQRTVVGQGPRQLSSGPHEAALGVKQ